VAWIDLLIAIDCSAVTNRKDWLLFLLTFFTFHDSNLRRLGTKYVLDVTSIGWADRQTNNGKKCSFSDHL